MALRPQASFSSGELDPALHERTTLDKYHSGLATGRNIIIGKTGRIVSRMGRRLFRKTKLSDRRVIIFAPPYTGYLIEWGHQYVKVWAHEVEGISASFATTGSLVLETTHALTEDDLDDIHFEATNDTTLGLMVYVFKEGSTIAKLSYVPGGGFISAGSIFSVPSPPDDGSITPSGGPDGYYVDYIVTKLQGGQESTILSIPGGSVYKLPTTIAMANTVRARVVTSSTAQGSITECRFYRRPQNGGAYGFIGSSSYFFASGGHLYCDFADFGVSADYTHSPPGFVDNFVYRGGTDARVLNPKTGAVYQQRLLQVDSSSNKEVILASRPGYQNNYYRDYPLGSDSALKFKAGASGFAQILRLMEHDGLIAFTSIGVYLHTGELSPTNLAFDKKGTFVIDERIPPLRVPGGILFIDKATNVVRNINYSTELASYAGDELSIFSNHLFQGKKVTSWAFQDGDLPIVWVTFDDGTFAAFTYVKEHEMRAWTRCDSTQNIEYVAGTGITDKSYFVVEVDGERYIELTVPRYVSSDTKDDDAQWEYNESCAPLDSMVSWSNPLVDNLTGADVFTLVPVVAGEWDGQLTLTCGTSGLFLAGTLGAVGATFRWFDDDDGTHIDLEVISRTSNNEVVVQPTDEWDEDNDSGFNLYETKNTFTGLDHLEGEDVSIVVDGAVVASPNNNIENYPQVTVVSGSIDLPDDMLGAIVHIGRPVTMDTETLDIDTVEQRPVLIESQTVNKVYIKVFESRGLYLSYRFPEDNKISDDISTMKDVEKMQIDYEDNVEILGNRPFLPQTQRVELTLDGDWKSQGRMCLRQVDPLHFEILSIIPDTHDLRRDV